MHAPFDVVWALLTEPAAYGRWAGTLVSVEPPGSARPGQRVTFAERAFGRDVRVVTEVVAVQDSPRRLRLDVHLPFGIVNHEAVACAALGPDATFVSFN